MIFFNYLIVIVFLFCLLFVFSLIAFMVFNGLRSSGKITK